MHGVLLWSSRGAGTSSLITWQDGRAGEGGFLEALRRKTGEDGLRAGYGIATLAWLAAREPDLLRRHDRASTIADRLASLLCGSGEAITDPTHAASWGCFDIAARRWKIDAVEAAGVPASFLPEVRPSGSRRGTLEPAGAARWGLPGGIPVAVPIGDNQASLHATLSDPAGDLAITLGTGGQLSAVAGDLARHLPGAPASVEFRPYLGDASIAVCAALCGGSSFEWLAAAAEGWCRELGVAPPDRDEAYRRLDALACGAFPSPLRLSPTFAGERHDPALRGTIAGIDLANFSLANVAAALAAGIAGNLRGMMPPALLEGRRRIVGSGNAVRRLRCVRRAIEETFGLPLAVSAEEEEAALGAALVARTLLPPGSPG